MNKAAVKQLTKEGCIVEKEAAESLTEEDIEAIKELNSPPMYITEDMLDSLREKIDQKLEEMQKQESESNENLKEDLKEEMETEDPEESVDDPQEHSNKDKNTKNKEESGTKGVKILDEGDRNKRMRTKVEVMDEKEITKEEKDVPEFLEYYNSRYDKMKKLLMRRKELQAATTLNRLSRRNEGEDATAIGLVKDKYSTNSGKYIVEIEDKTDTFKVLVDEREGDMIVPDEALGFIGSMGGDILYANKVVRPDLPIPDGVKTTEDNVEAAYISDLHIGSKDTMYNKLQRFAEWLKSEDAKNVGYLVITGDLVEGVGVYPGQEEELRVNDVYEQYRLFEEWVDKLPERIQVIASPGNHDIVRLSEPQPILPEKALPNIRDYNNVHLVQNPQMVRLHGFETKGIKNLMYHGSSFDDHVDKIQDLREKAYEEPQHVMIDLLKRRHLAPTYGDTPISPEGEDQLVIYEKPDIFVAGHFHSHCNQSYKGVNVINSSSFQAQTDFQKRVGHEPDPGKVTIVNYKNRNTRVKNFM